MEASFDWKPSACFEVEKVIGVSSDGTYQVQWAPSWVSRFHLVGCEHLIQEFLRQQTQNGGEPGLQLVAPHVNNESNDIAPQNKSNDVATQYKSNDVALENNTSSTGRLSEQNECLHKQQSEEDEELEIQSLPYQLGDVSHQSSESVYLEYNEEQLSQYDTRPAEDIISEYTEQPTEEESKPDVMTIAMENFPRKLPTARLEVSDTRTTSKHVANKNNSLLLKPVSMSLKIEDDTDTTEYADRAAPSAFKDNWGDNTETHGNLQAPTEMHQVQNGNNGNNDTISLPLSTSTERKKYSCSFCAEQFVYKSRLTVHERTHTGYKPYICSYCEKGFIHQGNLNQHMRTHTGEKPYICEICGKSFSHRNTCNNHMQTHVVM